MKEILLVGYRDHALDLPVFLICMYGTKDA